MSITPEEFARIREQLIDPEHVRKAYVRSIGEFFYILKIKVTWLNPKFGEAVIKVPHPIGWRREILMRHRKSIIKNLYPANIQSPNLHRQLGRIIGLFENTISGLDNEHFYPQEEEFWEKVFAPFLDIDEEVKKKIEDYLENAGKAYESIQNYILTLPMPEQKEFSLGRAEKLDAVFGANSTLTYTQTTTEIYNFLLMTGDMVRRLDSVEEIYEFAKLWLKNDFPHDLDSFRKICNRIGLRGANRLATERRMKSIDRVNRAVQ